MYVACSTLCFGRHTLEAALRAVVELEFTKVDIALHEGGRQLKPSEVAADVAHAAARLRQGTGLTCSAFSVVIEADTSTEFDRQFKAVCRLARVTAVPLVTLPTAPAGTGLDAEAQRLIRLLQFAESEGVLLTVPTVSGTVTEDPDTAVALCQQVPGLGLTLDPSHYLAGPNQNRSYDHVFPYVRHVHLRDTGVGPNQFQVRVGQGEIEYGRVISQLARHGYDRILSVDIRDIPDAPFAMEPEVRKLKYLLESLV